MRARLASEVTVDAAASLHREQDDLNAAETSSSG
jgi:hypothetical protein